ncbi:MAG: hypothetical protein E6K40_08505, partial [Gammaproteobacteria bacterium]
MTHGWMLQSKCDAPADEIRRPRGVRNVKTSRGARERRCAAVAPLIVFGAAIVKAFIGDGPCKAALNAARNLLTRPGWRPALAMLTSGFVGLLTAPEGRADPPDFHHAPRSAASLENPYHGQAPAAQAGGRLYALYCAACHGRSAEGTGNIPALAHGPVQNVADGEVFWFITKGSNSGAMPSWASLP